MDENENAKIGEEVRELSNVESESGESEKRKDSNSQEEKYSDSILDLLNSYDKKDNVKKETQEKTNESTVQNEIDIDIRWLLEGKREEAKALEKKRAEAKALEKKKAEAKANVQEKEKKRGSKNKRIEQSSSASYYTEKYREDYVERLRQKVFGSNQEKNNSEKDILELLLENMGELREYFIISKFQAKKIFKCAVNSFFCGVVILAVAAVIFSFTSSLGATVVLSLIGVMCEFISTYQLTLYRQTLKNMHKYFASLEKTSLYLSNVNLVGKMEQDKQSAAYLKIILSTMPQYEEKQNK